MTEEDTQPKAYIVCDGDYGDEDTSTKIVFAKTGVEARRIGARKLDLSFEEVASCKRAPEFDKYADDGKVPIKTFIEEHGWWFRCFECERMVEAYTLDDDGNELQPVYVGSRTVYCSQSCKDSWDALKEKIGRCELEVTAAALEKWPGIEIIRACGYVTEQQNASVTFKFPGGRYTVDWFLGDATVRVCLADVDAWRAFCDSVKNAKESA